MTSYTTLHIMEYLPKRYEATPKQENARQVIFNFKNGFCSETLKNLIVGYINAIKKGTNAANLMVCFIPASTHMKTIRRYAHLASIIKKETGIDCNVNTIMPKTDHESGHIAGKRTNPAEDFEIKGEDIKGKNIILMDDIITRGTTFFQTARRLEALGADSILGLFVAKTINPGWARRCA